MMSNKEHNRSFLGTGWDFPPRFNKATAGVAMTSDQKDIERSLEILLSTRLGERIMRPDFGCDLTDMIFEPLSASVKAYIKDLVEKAILLHEPRILLKKVELEADKEQLGLINILVEYVISSTNSRKNYVYPFYLEEGSDVKK
jgi:phage baseplate assembly protein W